MANPIDFIVRQGLQATTNVVVGQYATVNAAPLYGMIVSGNVGIGTSTIPAGNQLAVTGNIILSNIAVAGTSGIRFADGTYQATSASSYSTSPGGSTNSIQYNAGGSFGGNTNFVFHTGNTHVGIGTIQANYALQVNATDGPAFFATRNGTDYQIFVGNNTPSGSVTTVGYNPVGLYSYIGTGSGVANSNIVILQDGRVGVGVTNPISRMDISGNLAVGTYAGTSSVPTNGLAVSGSVGIGVTNPSGKLGILAGTSQTGLYIQSAATPGDFLLFQDSNPITKFRVDSSGTIQNGTWQGATINAPYGGTGQSTYSAGDLLYAATSSPTTLSKLPIGSTGNILTVSNGLLPTWGNVNLSSSGAVSGVLPMAFGGTNAAVFAGSAFVATTANGLVMTSVTSTTNAAVVFNNSGVPSAVTGGPYTYLTTGAGGGALSFGKVDLVNGVTGTLTAGNGGTGLSTFAQYSILYANTANNWNALGSAATSALVTSSTNAPQWTSGTTANRVLRTDGTTITFSQVVLTTDVSGILPYANGGTNANTNWTQGSIIFAGASSFAQNNAQFFWDNTNNRLGLATTTPTTTLDVNGAATIRNGGNIVAGGLYVQAGVANFVNQVIAASVVSNSFVQGTSIYSSGPISAVGAITGASLTSNGTTTTTNFYASGAINGASTATFANITSNGYVQGASIYSSGPISAAGTITGQNINSNTTVTAATINATSAANVQGLTSNTTVLVNGTMQSTSYQNGALIVQGGVGVGGDINVAGNVNVNSNVTILGNLYVKGNTFTVSSTELVVFGPIIEIGVGNAEIPYNGPEDRGVEFHYISQAGGNAFGFFGMQKSSEQFLFVTNASYSGGSDNDVFQGTPGTAVFGNIVIGSAGANNQAFPLPSTNSSTGALVIGGSGGIGIGGGLNAGGAGYFAGGLNSGGITTVNNLTSNNGISGTTISGSGVITGLALVSNSYIQGTSIYSSGPISAVGTITSANMASNGYVTASSVTALNTITANNLYANLAIASGGPISAASAITAATLTSNGFIFGTSLNTSGTATVNLLLSNSSVQGTNIYSSVDISAVGKVTAASLTSNGYINGTSINSSGPLSAAGALTVATVTSNGFIFGTSLNTSGTATVNLLLSNSSVQGTNIYSSVDISAAGKVTAASLTSNGFIFGSSLNTSGTATVNLLLSNSSVQGTNIYSSGAMSAVGNMTAAALISNSYINGTSINSSGPLSAAGALTVSTVTSNGFIFGTQINTSGSGIFNSVTSNTFIFGASLNTSGTATVNLLLSNSSVQGTNIYSSVDISAVGKVTAASLTSNGYINGTSINSSGPLSAAGALTVATVTSNGFIFGTQINTSGNGTFANVVSNGYVQGASIYSSGPISAVGTITAANMTSNGFVFASSLNTSGTATVNALLSNGTVQGNNVYSSVDISAVGKVTAASLTSNGFIFGSSLNTSGTATVNALTSNGAVNSQTVTTTGVATFASVISNTTVTGNSFIMNGNLSTTSTTGTLTLDIFDKTIYRTAHYFIQVTDNTASTYHSEQVMLIHDGTTVYKTEYNLIYTAAPLGAFDSTISGNQVSLTFTATAATNKTIRVLRTALNI